VAYRKESLRLPIIQRQRNPLALKAAEEGCQIAVGVNRTTNQISGFSSFGGQKLHRGRVQLAHPDIFAESRTLLRQNILEARRFTRSGGAAGQPLHITTRR